MTPLKIEKVEWTAEQQAEYRRQGALVGEADHNNPGEMAFLNALVDEILQDVEEQERLAEDAARTAKAGK